MKRNFGAYLAVMAGVLTFVCLASAGAQQKPKDDVVDAEFVDVDEKKKSPWRK